MNLDEKDISRRPSDVETQASESENHFVIEKGMDRAYAIKCDLSMCSILHVCVSADRL